MLSLVSVKYAAIGTISDGRFLGTTKRRVYAITKCPSYHMTYHGLSNRCSDKTSYICLQQSSSILQHLTEGIC